MSLGGEGSIAIVIAIGEGVGIVRIGELLYLDLEVQCLLCMERAPEVMIRVTLSISFLPRFQLSSLSGEADIIAVISFI